MEMSTSRQVTPRKARFGTITILAFVAFLVAGYTQHLQRANEITHQQQTQAHQKALTRLNKIKPDLIYQLMANMELSDNKFEISLADRVNFLILARHVGIDQARALEGTEQNFARYTRKQLEAMIEAYR